MFRRLIKLVHPQGIPGIGAIFYTALSSGKTYQRHYDMVADDIVRLLPSGALLDVGTGPGWLLHKLYRRGQYSRLAGVAQAGLDGKVELYISGAGRMPFPDNSFDGVVSTGSIHHWKDMPGSLNELWRVLKPGGKALLYDLITNTPTDILKEMARTSFRRWLCVIHSYEE